jgi:hypothetical protein
MRSRPLLAVLVAMSAAAVAVSAAPAVTLAAPAGCAAASNGIVLACDHAFGTKRVRSIGLLGDSVLLGSSPGMSSPSLPDELATRGWGPIRMTTTLGMRTYNPSNTNASAYHVLGRWKAAGFAPQVIVVNLGANHFTDCTTVSVNTCISRITQLMDRIQSLYPTATVWWAKTNARSLITGGFQPGMLGWNLALDRVAAARPTKLVVWDWPSALVANRIATDPSQIHPSSGTQYAIRSRLVAVDVSTRMPAVKVGTAVVPPAPSAGAMGFTAADPPATLGAYTVGPSPVPVPITGASAGAAAVTVTVHAAAAAGFVRVDRCGAGAGVGTRLYFAAGQTRSVQAVTALDAANQLCLRSTTAGNVAVSVSVTHQGTFAAGSGSLLTPRAVTTNQQASFVGGAATLVVAPAPATAVAATLVLDATAASAGGTLVAFKCGAAPAPDSVELTYAKGETTSGQVFAPLDGSGRLCLRATGGATLPKVFVRVTGTFSTGGQLAFRPVSTSRVFDLRATDPKASKPLGGWVGRRFPGQSMTFAPFAGAQAATLVVTSYESTARGANVVWQRGAKPATALFYFPAGLVPASNTVTVPVAPNGYAIGDTTGTGIQRVAIDVAGWWVPAP